MAVSQTLSLTEVAGSADIASNTSKIRIVWKSTQTGDSWNGYTRVAKYYVSINGGAEQEYAITYALPKESTKTIVDTTITVPHNTDGTGSVKVRTWMDTSISAGVVQKTETLNLITIPRASTISYVSNVTLGNACVVRWIPLSKDFTFKLVFLVGDWWYITDLIKPNATSLYTYASYYLPMEVANHFPNSRDANMTVELYTYSNAAGENKIGTEDSTTCKVSIPENKDTLPSVVMNLSPVGSLPTNFNGLYVQNKTRVKASFTGSQAKYSANISSYSMDVDGKTYHNEPYQSDLLSKYGITPVTGTVGDTRGCLSSITQNIDVIPYAKPSLIPYTGESSIVCKRCDSNGDLTPSGTCLHIKVGRQYSKVMSGGVQKNFCSIQFKYKAEGATSWISQKTILEEGDTADSVDAILTGINLSLSTTYIVEIEAVDTIGESYSTKITIPTADVTVHLRAGGKAVGVGKYAEKDYIVDIDDEWEVNVRGTLKAKEINTSESIQTGDVNASGTIQAGDVNISETLQVGHIAAIDLYDGKDFNTLIYKTGYYTSKSAPIGALSTNYPVNETGVLEVISSMYYTEANNSWWGFAYQTYRTYTGNVYVRSYYSTTGWGAWKKVTLT